VSTVNFYLEDECQHAQSAGSSGILEDSPQLSFKDLRFEEIDSFYETSEPPSPDTSTIESVANSLYPLLLARHAPCPGTLGQCAECSCKNTKVLYSCSDCITLLWFCKACIVKLHTMNPLHQVHSWNKKLQCKESTALVDLGLTLQLMHEDGTPCKSKGNHCELQILHINGLHRVKYQLCACDITQLHPQPVSPRRLMANGLFPATFTAPTAAFSFQLLSLFDILNLYDHINVKQFCDSIIANVPEDKKKQEDVSVSKM
jgi:hypothetical protein